MKIKKHIAKLLLVGMLANNFSVLSNGGTLSPDTRYETFEGDFIEIDDVLEEDKVDIKMDGNSMVNVLSYDSGNDFYWLDGTIDNNRYIEITAESSNYKNFFIKKESVMIKPNTTYTFFIDIVENTLIRDDGSKGYCLAFGGTNRDYDASFWREDKWLDGGITGKYSFTLETKDDFSDVKTGDRGFVNTGTTGKIKFRYMIVEGDHIGKDVDYFNGMKSVGEQEDGNHNIEIKSQNENNQSVKNKIILNEPLRGIYGYTKDKIIKKDGKWVVERNYAQLTLSPNSTWYHQSEKIYDDNPMFLMNLNGIDNTSINVISDKLSGVSGDYAWNNDSESISLDVHGNLQVRINKHKLDSIDVDGFKKYISQNQIVIIYKLKTPIYETLNSNSSINLLKETTYISNNSTIPATMKLTVDRVANRAREFSEVARLNPTVENISRARMWINLMKESTLKDEFQFSLDEIDNIIDLPVIEKKEASVNTDIYIRPQNMLSMTLSTNNITFEDVDSTEDVEKLNALNIRVISSLPYSLNAYLASEIQNSDKSNILDKSILNIKESSQQDYKIFNSIDGKVILKDNNLAGKQISHNIDLKLDSSRIQKADVYKTTVKFEVEQK